MSKGLLFIIPEILQMAFKVHFLPQYPNNKNTTYNLLKKNRM